MLTRVCSLVMITELNWQHISCINKYLTVHMSCTTSLCGHYYCVLSWRLCNLIYYNTISISISHLQRCRPCVSWCVQRAVRSWNVPPSECTHYCDFVEGTCCLEHDWTHSPADHKLYENFQSYCIKNKFLLYCGRLLRRYFSMWNYNIMI